MADNSSPSLSPLTTKQKVVGIVTLAIMVFIIYEVYGLIFGGGGNTKTEITPTSAPIKPMTANMPTAGGVANTSASAPAAVLPAGQANTLTTVSALTPQREGVDPQKQQQQQQAYLESVNQLQLLKIKRETKLLLLHA